MNQKMKRIPLKTVYYMAFTFLIVVPLLTVLLIALFVLNQQFKKQAIENIERAQDNIVTELLSDINVMSMRLSHLIYTNNNEIIGYAAGTDTEDILQRYEYEQKLSQAGNLVLEPVKDIISVGFYMKDGKETYIKNSINRTQEEIKEKKWYQAALATPNVVFVGSYNTESPNDLYIGGKKNLLVLVFALSPDVTTDRSQKIEMVTFYQVTGAGDTIADYDRNYLKGNNKLGITMIKGEDGEIIFTTVEDRDFPSKEYTCVKTPARFGNTTWYVESYIKTTELTEEFWKIAKMILLIAVFIFLLAGYYSGYFLKSIVNPITEIDGGLKQVEEGNLEVHISPQGQFEIRNVIHQFNAMVRRLKVLIEEYEERGKQMEKKPEDYFCAMLKNEMSPQETAEQYKEFFAERYTIIGFMTENYSSGKNDTESVKQLTDSFWRNPRFAARCMIYVENPSFYIVFYRISEEDYLSRISRMVQEIQAAAKKELGILISACVGRELYGYAEFLEGTNEVREKSCLHFLYGEEAVILLENDSEKKETVLLLSEKYKRLAEMLYIADEKNINEEKEKLFSIFDNNGKTEAELHAYAAVLAIGVRFSVDNGNFFDIFEKRYNYIEKIERLEDIRSLKLWMTNFFGWIMDYSATKLNVLETDAIVKAKRYITNHYDDAGLSLSQVAEYVELNEKYFTNRFTKETGETFSSYLTGLRMQKAKELLKTTTFKIYEISEMVGYHSVEHFNRTFKKLNNITPAQYRKTM